MVVALPARWIVADPAGVGAGEVAQTRNQGGGPLLAASVVLGRGGGLGDVEVAAVVLAARRSMEVEQQGRPAAGGETRPVLLDDQGLMPHGRPAPGAIQIPGVGILAVVALDHAIDVDEGHRPGQRRGLAGGGDGAQKAAETPGSWVLDGFLRAVEHLTMRNTRRYGGYIVHFGIVLIFIGLAGAAFNQDKQMEMTPGTSMELGRYTILLQTFTQRPGPNYIAERATIEVLRDGKSVMLLYPERRRYNPSGMTGTMVSIYSTLREDLYVVYAGPSPETGQPVIHAYVNPLVKWIWLGGVVLVLGTGIALLPNRQPVLALRTTAEPARQPVLQPVPAARPQDAHD